MAPREVGSLNIGGAHQWWAITWIMSGLSSGSIARSQLISFDNVLVYDSGRGDTWPRVIYKVGKVM